MSLPGRRRSPGPAQLALILALLCLLPTGLAAAAKSQDPVLLQARKDLGARKPELAMAALEALLAKDIDALTRGEATMALAQAYVARAQALSRAKDDSGASELYDKTIALLEPFAAGLKDRKARDGADQLLSQAYMANADANIRLKNYDKALLALQSFSAKNPERFDQANAKVRRIFAIREEYTKLAGEIRDRALSSAGNDPAIPGMIERLRGLDPYANKDILNVLLEVRTRIANLDLLRNAMTRARGLAEAGNRAGAAAAYIAGFDPASSLPSPYWQEFVNAGYDLLEVRDAETSQVVVVGADGLPRLAIVDAKGRVVRVDAQGRPTKGPGGFVYSLDPSGNPETLVFRDFGGQRQLEPGRSIVTAVQDFIRKEVAFAGGLEAVGGPAPAYVAAMETLRQAFLRSDATAASAALPEARRSFDELDADRQRLLADELRLLAILRALPAKHADGRDRSVLDWSWLSYAGFFIAGRPPVEDYAARDQRTDPLWRPEAERGKTEGLAGYLHAQATASLGAAQDAADASVGNSWSAALAAWSAGRWNEARAGFDRTTALLSPERALLDFWRPLGQGGAEAGLPTEVRTAIAGRLADLAGIEARIGLAPSLSRMAALRASIDELSRRLAAYPAPQAGTEVLASTYTALAALRTELKGYEASLDREAGLTEGLRAAAQAATTAYAGAGRPSDRPGAEERSWESELAASQEAAHRLEASLVALSTGYETDGLEGELGSRSASVGSAAALIAGSPSTIPARAGLVDPRPSAAASLLGAEQARLGSLAAALADLGRRLAAEDPWVRGDPAVAALAGRVAAAARSAAALETRRGSLLAQALAKKTAAAAALAAAQKSFGDAEALLATAGRQLLVVAQRPEARRNLDGATTAREAGYARFLDAMNGDFDQPTWDAGIKRYEAIGKAVNDARDQYAKLEVDRLLSDAQHSYDLGNFDASFESLSESSNLWKERYPGVSYPPLDFWLNLVRLARDTGNSRVIRPNDPLYTEMSQYLSLARMAYEDGIGLQKGGRSAEARQAFLRAQNLIANVTRTFPLNADAGFLSLQILKATSEADFQASLPARIDDAARILQSDPASGYARIADLARIEPANQRLARLLVQAEIATGKRRPAPTVAERDRSRQLTDQARQLIKTGRQADLVQAERMVAQALALDPNNRDAQTLSLSIQTLRGGGPDKVLDVEDARRLADARLYFSQGQYNQARDAINVLLSSEATRTRDVLLLDQQLNQLNY